MDNWVRISTVQNNPNILSIEHPMGLVGYYVKRENLKDLQKAPHTDKAGFYFLLQDKVIKYVGQGNTRTNNTAVIRRVMEHDEPAKNFWNEAIIFTDKNNSLHDVRRNTLTYIESIYIGAIGVDSLENKTEGNIYIDDKEGLYKADFAMANANFVLKILNIVYDKAQKVKAKEKTNKTKAVFDYSPCIGKTFHFKIDKHNFRAEILCLDVNRWEVKAHTTLRPFSKFSDPYVRAAREDKPILDGKTTEDLVFPSANSALKFINGQYVNAPDELTDENGVKLSQIARRVN